MASSKVKGKVYERKDDVMYVSKIQGTLSLVDWLSWYRMHVWEKNICVSQEEPCDEPKEQKALLESQGVSGIIIIPA